MFGSLKWLLLSVVTILAQDPRRGGGGNFLFCKKHEIQPLKTDKDNFMCNDIDGKCLSKRLAPDDVSGPFWANRGKKDPVYLREPLFAEEPYWLLVRGDSYQEDPFFLSRGKKETGSLDTREVVQDDSPFFAARGKKFKMKH